MTNPTTVSPLRQRMFEDMASRQLAKGTQVGHIRAVTRFAAWLKRSPDTATVDEVRAFQLHLMQTGTSIQTRNRTMTGAGPRVGGSAGELAGVLGAWPVFLPVPLSIARSLSALTAAMLLAAAGGTADAECQA